MKKTPQDYHDRVSQAGKIIDVDIVPEMEKSYLDYAMSVIVSRALPDVRDGLKPVQRRILFATNQMGLTFKAKYSKSAKIVGEVLGKYHPHGDSSVYMAMVRMAQEFSLRYPLIQGQGNFGSVDNDPPAAMRYTEAKMSKISAELIADIDKETVSTMDNFDGTIQEPTVLPSKIPNLLLNGADGIAVGMATKIPPHNLKEICLAINHLLDHCTLEIQTEEDQIPNLKKPKLTTKDIVLEPIYQLESQKFNLESSLPVEELIQFVQGPDFPTGAEIYGKAGIIEMYKTGRGKFMIRGKAKIEETKKGRQQIIVTEIPYQVNKADLVLKIADLVRNKKIKGISDLRDESDRKGIRIVIELKKIGRPKSTLNKIYKFTPLQTSYSSNIIALVDNRPQTLNLRQLLLYFLRHREQIVRKRTIFELKGAKIRSHILEGLKIALDNLDEVIATIKKSPTVDEAKLNLINKFKLTDLQADAILEMQLRRLAALEVQKIEDEYQALKLIIEDLTSIITKPEKMIAILKEENQYIQDTYQDNRKTKIYIRELEQFNEEDLIPNIPVIITITKTGYIKKVPKQTYRSQKRGGKGVVGMVTKEEDEIENVMSVDNHDDLLFFTNKGKVFKSKVYDLEESNRQSKGQAIVNLIDIKQDEQVQAVLPINGKDSNVKYILLATNKGIVKKTNLNKFNNIRQSGLIAINLDPQDHLCWAKHTTGMDEIFMVTQKGKCIRFKESDIRPMGRNTKGVRGINLKPEDSLVGLSIIDSHIIESKHNHKTYCDLLVATSNGLGKRTNIFQYPIQKRGGFGVKVANINPKTDQVSVAQTITHDDHFVILVSKKGITIKLPLKNIPRLNRNTKGVILMRFKTNSDKLSTLTITQKNKIDEVSQTQDKQNT